MPGLGPILRAPVNLALASAIPTQSEQSHLREDGNSWADTKLRLESPTALAALASGHLLLSAAASSLCSQPCVHANVTFLS